MLTNSRLLGSTLLSIALFAFLVLIAAACQPQDAQSLSYQGTELTDGQLAPEFTLVDQHGTSASLSDFRGRAVVLTFLDSTCVDVCPFTALILRNAAKQLAAASSRTAFLGVNVNPLAYKVEDVRLWTEQNHLEEIPGWRFLTGTPPELSGVWQSYAVLVEASGDHVIHSAGIYLIDKQGRERWYFGIEPDAGAIEPMSRLLSQRIQALFRER